MTEVKHSVHEKKKPGAKAGFFSWCGREDSNFHGLPHSDLNAARLPIPPRPQATKWPVFPPAGGHVANSPFPYKPAREGKFSRNPQGLAAAHWTQPNRCALWPEPIVTETKTP